MLYYLNGEIKEININDFITDNEYYKYIMEEIEKNLNLQ